jgi:hypothetical protein
MLINLQVLRYLRIERKILHRDVSKLSIRYVPQEPSSAASRVHSPLALGAEGDTLCFIKCLLGERYVICMLIFSA